MKNGIEIRKNWHETKEKLKKKFVKINDLHKKAKLMIKEKRIYKR